MFKVVFTGGGTAGHVLPNITLIKAGLQRGWKASYLGSKCGIERELVGQLNEVDYCCIAAGKLRRYFSWQNVIDLFKVVVGVIQSIYYLYKISPDVIFSKGGYVGLPVTVAAWLLRVPVIVHESDLTVGLANRIAFMWANCIALTFKQTKDHLAAKWQSRAVITGMPLRSEFSVDGGEIATARYWLPTSDSSKPFVVVFGGSLGAAKLNEAVRATLPKLLSRYRVLHVCGRGGVIEALQQPDYRQFEYINEYFPMVLQAADIVVARAGATTIYELLYLSKPHILVPLDGRSSRGDQLVNAQCFANLHCSMVIQQSELAADPERLLVELDFWRRDPTVWQQALQAHRTSDATSLLIKLIEQLATGEMVLSDGC